MSSQYQIGIGAAVAKTITIEEDDSPNNPDPNPRLLVWSTLDTDAVVLTPIGDLALSCKWTGIAPKLNCVINVAIADDPAVAGSFTLDVVDQVTGFKVTSFV